MSGINPFLVFTLAVAASVLVIPLAWRVAPRFGLLDQPDARKVHTTPVPRVGGWGITVGSAVPLILSFQLDPLLQSFFLGMLALFLFGVWDDARELGHWTKFAGQLLAVSIVVLYGDLYVARLPFLPPDTLSPAAGKAFTIFAMVGAINAINHSDGLDGLAAGESLLSLVAIAVLGYMVESELVVGIALAAIGGVLGFLRYNSHPARVFMGDAGSQVLGFTLSFLVIYLTQVAHTATSAALPLLLLGLPIADILAVLVLRIRARMNWFKATRNHVHHRLLALGFDHYETVIVIYTIQVALVVSAVVFRYESDVIVTAIYLGVVTASFGMLVAAERSGFRLRAGGNARSALTAAAAKVAASPVLLRGPPILIAVLVPSFMLFASFSAANVPRDFGAFAGALSLLVAAVLLRGARSRASRLLRLCVYAAAILSAYLLADQLGEAPASVRALTTVGVIVLAAAIVAYLRFGARHELGTTPTDYLIVFGVLALAVFGSVDIDSRAIVELVVLTTALLYGCEAVIGTARAPVVHGAALVALAVMAVRGVL